ncbi:hypothetical protein [Streptomyces diastatochromogenes]|uniref:hypothetical protein n=1 Tax=Streptomyces diastatochromogenes TaxID=42236 RepID=UPI003663BCB8
MKDLAMDDHQEELPLHFGRPFRPWLYEVSHRRLVLRSQAGGEFGETVDVVFLDVLGMKLKSNYASLSIAPAEHLAEIDDFVNIPERHRSRYMKLLVSDGAGEGFVVCGTFHVLRE